jgi:DUF1680 family protein
MFTLTLDVATGLPIDCGKGFLKLPEEETGFMEQRDVAVARDPGETSADGPVAPRPASHALLRPLSLNVVRLRPDGPLGAWQEVNGEVTLPHCIAHVRERGNVDNLRRVLGHVDGDFRGLVFADSDVYKTLEAAGWELHRAPRAEVEEFVEATTRLLAEVQEDDGYLNSWYQREKPERKLSEFHWGHEMYCAGHLMQAAVAVARATGRTDLLGVATRFADLLVLRFGDGGEEAIDGHPEIETALVELARLTDEQAYLRLAERFVELRGRGLLGDDRFGANYFQDHAPVREATEATGHAVRQLYLAAGVTDVYLETGDPTLLTAMRELWENMFSEKTYITGAHGSRHRDEAFGDPYELPPDRAYGETCAAIASFQWNWRMLLATGDGRYGDEMERVLYNAVSAGTSLAGNRFFYSNPLHLRDGHDSDDEDMPSGRLEWYRCPCCPPNLSRLVASLNGYLATTDDSGIQLHLLSAAELDVDLPDGHAALRIATRYPWEETATIVVDSEHEWTLALRVPAWCEGATLTVADEPVSVSPGADGYVRVRRAWRPGTEVRLTLPMPPRVLVAHPRVDAVRGCVAWARGPVVYCIEQHDQPAGVALEDIRVPAGVTPRAVSATEVPGVPVVLVGQGSVQRAGNGALYAEGVAPEASEEAVEVTAIPYFRWANRGPAPMRVWIPTS